MQEEKIKEAVKYFKENKGFDRFFIKLREKFETYDREAAGTIVLSNPTTEEKEALSLFMKKNYAKYKAIQIRVAKFQNRIDETRFDGIKVKKLVEEYFGLEIITKKRKRQIKQEKQEEFFNLLLKEQEGTRVYSILKAIIEERKEEYGLLKAEYNANKTLAKNSIKNACIAINNLPNKKTPLPVFSAQVLKNPHELDKTNITGRIFIMLICKELNIKKPKYIEELSEVYYNNNLLIDDLSNMVLCKNILGKINDESHKGWLGFVENNEAMQVTLAQLSKIDGVETKLPYVFVVENPAVFSTLSELTQNIGLVCTYGQVKLSGFVLLDLLVKNNLKLYYSGDIDPEGIQIADKLKQRYGENMNLIGFDVNTYYKNISNVALNKTRLKKLDGIKSDELKELSEYVRFEGKAAYEEKNLESIIHLVKELDLKAK